VSQVTGELQQDQARRFLLTVLNRRQHWVFVCLGPGGRFVATELRRRHYTGGSRVDWMEMGLPAIWLGGAGVLPIAIATRSRMNADDLATVLGEFSRRFVFAELLQSRRIIVVGDARAEDQRDVLQALDKWLCAQPGYERVGLQ
jgi:hypothetical protein